MEPVDLEGTLNLFPGLPGGYFKTEPAGFFKGRFRAIRAMFHGESPGFLGRYGENPL
jgi:hypothetical protein